MSISNGPVAKKGAERMRKSCFGECSLLLSPLSISWSPDWRLMEEKADGELV